MVCWVGFNQNSRWVALLVMKYVLFGKNCLGFVIAPGRTFAEFVAKKVTRDRSIAKKVTRDRSIGQVYSLGALGTDVFHFHAVILVIDPHVVDVHADT